MITVKEWSAAKTYFSVWIEHGKDKESHAALLSAALRGLAVLSLCGVFSMLLNIFTPGPASSIASCVIACCSQVFMTCMAVALTRCSL